MKRPGWVYEEFSKQLYAAAESVQAMAGFWAEGKATDEMTNVGVVVRFVGLEEMLVLTVYEIR